MEGGNPTESVSEKRPDERSTKQRLFKIALNMKMIQEQNRNNNKEIENLKRNCKEIQELNSTIT